MSTWSSKTRFSYIIFLKVEAKIEAIINPKATFLPVAFYGIVFGVTGVIMNDFAAVYENGYFQGYTKITWFVIILQVGSVLYMYIM